MKIDTRNFEPKDIIKFMREATNLTQEEFAKSIGKTKSWIRNNEYGRTDYYFKDINLLAKKHGFKITIEKEDKEKY